MWKPFHVAIGALAQVSWNWTAFWILAGLNGNLMLSTMTDTTRPHKPHVGADFCHIEAEHMH